MMYIYSYKQKSEGAQALKVGLPAKLIRHNNSKFVGNPNKTVINWGSSTLPPQVAECRVLNGAMEVGIASNKGTFFSSLSEATVSPTEKHLSDLVPYTLQQAVALTWASMGRTVVCRTRLTGSGGVGIVLAETPEQLVDAPLYTMYKKKDQEYRIHVGREGQIILMQRKARRLDHENPNWKIRNHANGFIFARQDVDPPADVIEKSKRVVANLGLDFGAVDVVYNTNRKRAYVLEVNTAPGLEGSTVQDYVNYFKSLN